MSLSPETAFQFNLFSHTIAVSQSIVTQWVVMAVIVILALLLTRNLGRIPSKKQSVLEMVVTMINNFVGSTMGNEYKRFFIPYIGTMAVFFTFLNLSGLIGVEPSTADINVTAAFALMTFFIVNGNAIMKHGLGGYLHGYIKPFAPMLPLNVIEKFTIPFSLCLRLFCNMTVGAIVIGLVYEAMGHFAFIVPIAVHGFFDVFDGLIQVFVFMLLTMVYTKIAATEE
jgi:F-type H+-transporting ATPase subunit a